METLDIDGVLYKKASAIAKELGYTTDYVGQLCRGGKIDAQLVGRSWYVSVNSITDHKKTRYRSVAEKSKQAVKKVVADTKKTAAKKPATLTKHFLELGKNNYPKQLSYETDQSELYPAVQKGPQTKHNVTVEHADAEKLQIGSASVPYTITTPERPKIKFSGSLSVVSLETDPYEEKVAKEPSAPKKAATATTSAFKKLSATPVAKKSVVATKNPPIKPKVSGRTTHIAIVDGSESPQLGGRLTFLVLSTAWVLAFIIFFGSSAVTSTVIATQASVEIAYSFDRSVLDASAFKALK